MRIAAIFLVTLFLACSTKDRLLSSPYTDWQLDHGGIPRDALEKTLSLEEAKSLAGPNENSLGIVVLNSAYLPGDQLWQYKLTRRVGDSAYTREVGIVLVRHNQLIRRVILESTFHTTVSEKGA